MPIFRYKAINETGKNIQGVIDADSISLAKERLRQEKILVTKLFPIASTSSTTLSASLLLAFTRELKQLLGAGLPLYECLLTIEEKYRKHRSHPLFLDLCDRLKTGSLLSSALSNHPQSFDAVYLSMIQAGERSGSLPWVFEQLYLLIDRQEKLKKQLLSALAYPAFLGCFCFFVIVGLLLFIIPSMQQLFEGRHLHPLTQGVIFLSQFLQNSILYVGIGLCGLILGWMYFFKKGNGKILFKRFLQKLPILKTLFIHAALIRFCRSCSTLLFGGVPLITALKISRQVMKHPLLEETIQQAEIRIIEGNSLSQELQKSQYIPSLMKRMLAMAEQTGQLSEMLKSLSDIYDQELERNLSYVTTFLQPFLLLVLGGIIGLVILSILLPLTDVSSLIST